MGDALMKDEQMEAIGNYVKDHIAEWINETNIIPFSNNRPNYIERDNTLSERIVRVEEAIKHQGELLERMLGFTEKRFEQVDKRFEQIDKRFEQIDKRFEELRGDMNNRFEELRQDMNNRFVQVDKRFSQIQWTMGLGFTLLAALMGIFNFL